MSLENPFLTKTSPVTGNPTGAVTAEDRKAMIRKFDRDQCRAALKLPDLQFTVIQALERRMRELEGGK